MRRCKYGDVEPLRELYRSEAGCQVIHDSIIRRGMADAYLLLLDGAVGGYGGVWTRYDPGRVMEFYTLPHLRAHALPMFRAMVAASGATEIEAQTNMPLMLLMLCDCARSIRVENVLFADAYPTALPCPRGVFRHVAAGERPPDPDAPWVIADGDAILACGGFLGHYNPPYGDIYMQVGEAHRRQGLGSYLVQELKRVCYEAGRRPAARCNADNLASRQTLQRAGMLPCGRLLVGDLAPA